MVNNRQTWIKIKEEYKEALIKYPYSYWMCVLSSTFAGLWADSSNEYEIKKLAQEFLTPTQIEKEWFVGEVALFRNLDATTTIKKQQIRLDFINYMINKCDEKVQINS